MFKNYYAALKPERTYANVLTTLAGFLFASQWRFDWTLLLTTVLGTTLVVMSACAVNNVTDRGIDAKMPRTRARATVTGAVPASQLTSLAILLGITGFWLLIAGVNWLTAVIGLIAYVDYVVLYSWSKRNTPWSTLIGTVSGAAPLVAGYTAVTGRFDTTALLLGLIMVFWQMVHFFAIAIFRRNDYAAADIPVWSVRYGNENTKYWMIAYTILYLATLMALAITSPLALPVALILILSGLYWLFIGIQGFRSMDASAWSRKMFGVSLVIVLLISATTALDPLLH